MTPAALISASRKAFHVPDARRTEHIYVIGKTRCGKSTVLEKAFIKDMRDGKGCAFFDPHGDFVDDLLRHVPQSRKDDVYYFDAATLPLALNPFAYADPKKPDILAGQVVEVFQHLSPNYFSLQMEAMLRYTVTTLQKIPGACFLDMYRILTDPVWRDGFTTRFSKEEREFWITDSQNGPRDATRTSLAVKLNLFRSSELFKLVFGNTGTPLDLRAIMDERRILLVRWDPQRMRDCDLLGALFITFIRNAAYSRTKVPKADRVPFYIYVDEFQRMMGGPFDVILSEMGKFGLSLTMAHQYLDQIDRKIASAIRGNVGFEFVMRLGRDDARYFDIPELPKYTIARYLPKNPIAEESGWVVKTTTGVPAPRKDNPRQHILDRMARIAPSAPIEDTVSAPPPSIPPPIASPNPPDAPPAPSTPPRRLARKL